MTATTPVGGLADVPVRILEVLDGYTPTGVAEGVWAGVFPEARGLVLRAGPVSLRRVETDLQAIAAAVRHLVARGRPVTLVEVLADSTLDSLDQDLAIAGRTPKTREKLRGQLRRLQAARNGVPWRRPRRADGTRAATLPGPELAGWLAGLVDRAVAAAAAGDRDAAALVAVVAVVRRDRRGARVEAGQWAGARRCAKALGVALTRPELDAAVVHEVLLEDAPLAVLAARHRLTRRDLDLGLAHARLLPDTPSDLVRSALRGVPTGDRPGDCRPGRRRPGPGSSGGDGPAARPTGDRDGRYDGWEAGQQGGDAAGVGGAGGGGCAAPRAGPGGGRVDRQLRRAGGGR